MKHEFWMMTSSMDNGENGLYCDHKFIVCLWKLGRDGYDVWQMCGWSQKALATVAKRYQ